MKKYSYTTVKLVLVLLLSAPIASALTVEEVLSAMPPDNAASASLLFDKAFEEGPALIKALCARITPSADGVDAELTLPQGTLRHIFSEAAGWVEKVIPPSGIYKGRKLSELWAEVI